MPDNTTIERTIYRLEIDESGYIRGAEAATVSTQKLTQSQERANQRLENNQKALATATERINDTKKALESYTGTNEKYRRQLELDFQDATKNQIRLTEVVAKSQAAYDKANTAAQNFLSTAERAANIQAPTGTIPVPGAAAAAVIPPIVPPEAFQNFDLSGIVSDTTDEFEQLRQAIELADESLKGMNEESDEFKKLAPIVQQGKDVLALYDKAAQGSATSTKSLRTELTQGRNELVRMEQAGQAGTAAFQKLELKVAELTDAYQDQQQRLRVLSSDTRALDFGVAAVQSAINAYQVYTSLTILAGNNSEELQKKTQDLFAAMQLLSAATQLYNQFSRGGVIITNLASVAQAAYTATVGASTGALRAFRLALLGTGIGAAIAAIGFLVAKFIEYRERVKEAGEQQKLLNDLVHEANEQAGKQIADLKILAQTVKDTNIPMKERLEAVKALQKEFPEYFANLTNEKILTGDITKETDALTLAIQASARARVAKGKIDAIEAQRLDIEFQKEKIRNATARETAAVKGPTQDVTVVGGGIAPTTTTVPGLTVQEQKDIIDRRKQKALADQQEKDDALARQEQFLINFAGLNKVAKVVEEKEKEKDKETKKKEVREVVDIFPEEQARLNAQLAELQTKQADSVEKINKEFSEKLEVQRLRLQKEVKEKKLTKAESEILFKLEIQINEEQKKQAIDKLNKEILDAQTKLNEQLRNLQEKAQQDSLNLIEDEFQRRAALIDFNEKRELQNARDDADKRLAAIDLQRLSKLIDEQAYQDAKAVIIANGEQNALNIIKQFNNERKKLAADEFQDLLSAYEAAIFQSDLIRDRQLVENLRKELARFKAGEISFEQFQKNITKIQRANDAEREAANLQTEINKLAALDRELATIENKYSEHYKKLKAQRDQVEKDILNKQKQAATTLPPGQRRDVLGGIQTDEAAQQLARIDFIQDKIQSITTSVISFWQKANEAESQALDRSIALQEKRVDAAQKIAERGNAQYLKSETDRLKELQIARENAARRDLAINAALQASQLLVGITGAIAKIATPGIGPAETIAEIAIIVAALASGFALVKSLQGSQPKLAKGTPELKRRGEPAGIDTIPAWLNEGEAVIPTDKNKKYKKVVEAIYYGHVPADVLNEFVSNYTHNYPAKTESKYVYDTTNENLSIYKNFVSNVSNVPTKVLNEFITNYAKERKYFRGTVFVGNETPVYEYTGVYDDEKNKISKTIPSIEDTTDIIEKARSEKKNISITELITKVVNQSSDFNTIDGIESKRITHQEVKKFMNEYADVHKLIKNSVSGTIAKSIVTEQLSKHEDVVTAISVINNELLNKKVVTANEHSQLVKKFNLIVENYKVFKRLQTVKAIAEIKAPSQDIVPIQTTKEVLEGTHVVSKEFTNILSKITVKPLPLPNYERIKQAAEQKVTQDTRLAGLLAEQNKMLAENNALQRESIQLLKKNKIDIHYDAEGLAVHQMELIEQMRKDKRS